MVPENAAEGKGRDVVAIFHAPLVVFRWASGYDWDGGIV